MKKKELAKMSFDEESNYENMVPSIVILPLLELAYENGFLEYLNEAEKKKFFQLYKLADYWHDKYMEIEEERQKLEDSGYEGPVYYNPRKRRNRR